MDLDLDIAPLDGLQPEPVEAPVSNDPGDGEDVSNKIVVKKYITYEIVGGCLRGMNRSMVPALICMIGTCGFRLIYVLVIFPFFRTPQMLLLVYPITWILTGIVMNTAYFRVRKTVFARMAR